MKRSRVGASSSLASVASPDFEPAGFFRSVREFGVRGDGLSDDREAIQRVINTHRNVFVPPGTYRLGGALRLASGSWLKAHHQAHFVLADEAGIDSTVFMLSNAGEGDLDEKIRIEGGIWDGNNRRNVRGTDRPGAYTGVMFNFIGVRGLEVMDLRLRNAETYFIRLADVRDFRFSELEFSTSYCRPNQDGIHVAGDCHHGYISGIRGQGPGATQDDLVALVADDAMHRAQNLGLRNGPVSHVRVERLEAEDCHSFVRLASVFNPISDVDVEHVRGGCEACAVNMDALRYCAVPLFVDGDGKFPHGAGWCERVRLRDFQIYRSKSHLQNPLVLLESRMQDFRIERFRRDLARDAAPGIPTLRVAHLDRTRIEMLGVDAEAARQAAETCGNASITQLPEGFAGPVSVAMRATVSMDNPLVFRGDRFESLAVSQIG